MASKIGNYLSAALVLIFYAEPVAAIVIDDFSVGPITVERTGVDPGMAEQLGLNPTNVIGGVRSISVGSSGSPIQTLEIQAEESQLVFETGPHANTFIGYFDISYGSTSLPLNIDLTANGANAFLLEYETNLDRVPLARVIVSSPSGTDNPAFSNFDTQPLPGGRTRIVLPFDRYPRVDFENVTQISLDVARFPSASQITFYRFETVPEPTTAMLIVASLMSFAIQHRSRVAQN
ncbi:MAG: hypothetical protein RIB44_19775 [Lacipirellulaceae bacterium]